MKLLIIFLLAFGFLSSQDLYSEYIKMQVKDLPLSKAITVGKGKKELLTFINPDCEHCRREWQAIRPYLNRIKVYVFLLPSRSFPESQAKSHYIACSEDKLRALDEVLSGVWDGKPLKVKECPLVKEHVKAAERLGVQSTPYNIVLGSYKVIEGYSPRLLEELGIK